MGSSQSDLQKCQIERDNYKNQYNSCSGQLTTSTNIYNICNAELTNYKNQLINTPTPVICPPACEFNIPTICFTGLLLFDWLPGVVNIRELPP